MEIDEPENITFKNHLNSAQQQLKKDRAAIKEAIGHIAATIIQQDAQKGVGFKREAEKFAHMRHPCSS